MKVPPLSEMQCATRSVISVAPHVMYLPSREGLSEAHDISVHDVGVTVGVGVAVSVASHVFLAVTVSTAVPRRQ